MTRKILIVEDEEEISSLLEKKLAERGFEILKATTVAQAVQSVKAWLPDLILLDILLPDEDGSEAVKIFNADSSTQNIPILFLSGIVSRENGRIAQLKIGNRRYPAIPKPFTFKELMDEINSLILPTQAL